MPCQVIAPNEVVSGIALLKTPTNGGYSNGNDDFARALEDPKRKSCWLAKVIAKNRPLQMDIGRAVMTNTSSMMQAAGSFTELTYSKTGSLKTVLKLILGPPVSKAELLPQLRRFLARITHDVRMFLIESSY